MFWLFKKKEEKQSVKKPSAVAFVDYEHWYISLDRLYHQRPDVRAWRDELNETYELKEIVFFADFSNPSLRAELPQIREVTNTIIETQNTSSNFKKDFTDFIMLDHIYQRAMSSDGIDTFILFSGDGHFNSVASFLTTRMGKKVGVYAVRDALSNQLRSTASWVKLVPNEDGEVAYARLILKNLRYLEDNAGPGRKPRATFSATVEAVSRYYHVNQDAVAASMRWLLAKQYVTQEIQTVGSNNRSVRLIFVDWEKCRGDGLLKEG